MWHLITKVAEYAVIVNTSNEFLLLQFWGNHNHTWHFPGGRLNKGDQSIDGLLREIKEETNLEVYDISPFFTKIFDEKSPKYGVFFKAKVKEPYQVQISDEHQDFKWYKKTDINSINFKQPFYKQIIEDIL